MIEFDCNHRIKAFAVCVHPFSGYKTAISVKARYFHMLDSKQRGRMNISAKFLAICGFVEVKLWRNSQ